MTYGGGTAPAYQKVAKQGEGDSRPPGGCPLSKGATPAFENWEKVWDGARPPSLWPLLGLDPRANPTLRTHTDAERHKQSFQGSALLKYRDVTCARENKLCKERLKLGTAQNDLGK